MVKNHGSLTGINLRPTEHQPATYMYLLLNQNQESYLQRNAIAFIVVLPVRRGRTDIDSCQLTIAVLFLLLLFFFLKNSSVINWNVIKWYFLPL